ncbi:RNA polymerase subunit sigma-24 [Paenibacillus polymyxa]|uniref:ECF subfamily RNA polymerase sigma-24 subunit n=1 Tax=Paenibacillus polymyxa TaxID=1406 RepID=A0A378XTS6_PAEPO|nr:sigma factor-like helix-turn-helix DNA-binding protein [Paenibacillus polymyxa]MBE7897529.1 RNA polymerase subunit sigma-24 [Paenibacillus polymyxa]MBG9766192.1 RNA polymerase subunit sigma-24 [Paenibacillus polymyxa]MCC3257222.1 RNA polymerase subunit sigma-24 [Paenibacillus polymyxa]QPK51650.1 RNA polymerase subunit sigma-24 [Paenibacillus polymyxa]QPK56738.1 RNA polymerase subunit sigma-24 [Paenibacillus polymyxa]
MIPDEDTEQTPVVTDLGGATALSYRKARNIAARIYKKADADDKKIISGMISDCEFTEEWLVTGRRPGNKRGIERRAAYQREQLVDPLKMQAYVSNSKAGSPSNLTDWQRFQIQDALSRLSERERECYVMAHGECFSFGEIGNMLGISKGSVEEYVQRAQRKITEDLNFSLFLI